MGVMGDFLTEILDGRKRRSRKLFRQKKFHQMFKSEFKAWMAAKKEAAEKKKAIGSRSSKAYRRNRAIAAAATAKMVEARKAFYAKIRAYKKRDEMVDAVLELVEILDGRKRRSKKGRKRRSNKKFQKMFKSEFKAWMAAKKEAAGLKKRIGGRGRKGSEKEKKFLRNRSIWADAKSKAVEARKAFYAKIRAYRKRDEMVDAVLELVEILDGRKRRSKKGGKRRSNKERKKFQNMFKSWFKAWMVARKEYAEKKKAIGSRSSKAYRRNRAIAAAAKAKVFEARKAYFAKIRAYKKR